MRCCVGHKNVFHRNLRNDIALTAKRWAAWGAKLVATDHLNLFFSCRVLPALTNNDWEKHPETRCGAGFSPLIIKMGDRIHCDCNGRSQKHGWFLFEWIVQVCGLSVCNLRILDE